jgi:EAL domain-containing protein (putative c-di-GMP-specific phosphodiesterase class I)/DNA-binding response OmpR family regulator
MADDPMASMLDARIYIADDEPANIALLEAVLGRAGFIAISTFPDGQALLAAIDAAEPDLILLDLRMPVADGLSVLEDLPTHLPAGGFLPVLVLTADATRASRDRALSSGAHDYLTKPFDPAEVLLRVRNLLETRRLHQALRVRNMDLTGEVERTTRTLADREREWAGQAAALSHLEARETAEATAQTICDELSGLTGLTGVLVVALDAAGQAIPLARDASVDVRIRVNTPLAPGLTIGWAERVAAGPWVGPWESGFGSTLRRVPGELLTAMAIIPLRTSTALLGAIVVCTQAVDGITFLAGRLPVLESFGAVASALLAPGILGRQQRGEVRGEIESILERQAFQPAFQPIVDLATDRIVGYEALTRFDDATRPDRRFADAAAVGLGLELEAACLAAAAEAWPRDDRLGWLSLNVSPDLLLERRRLRNALPGGIGPVVLEVTEHVAIEDYVAIRDAVSSIAANVRVAVDDAGAGFASFRHILELRPDFVKLDIGLVHQIDRDAIRQALVAGIVYFARQSGCRLVAEGIETPGERAQLRTLGVDLGQGYLLGRPWPFTTMDHDRRAAALLGLADAAGPALDPSVSSPR